MRQGQSFCYGGSFSLFPALGQEQGVEVWGNQKLPGGRGPRVHPQALGCCMSAPVCLGAASGLGSARHICRVLRVVQGSSKLGPLSSRLKNVSGKVSGKSLLAALGKSKL